MHTYFIQGTGKNSVQPSYEPHIQHIHQTLVWLSAW